MSITVYSVKRLFTKGIEKLDGLRPVEHADGTSYASSICTDFPYRYFEQIGRTCFYTEAEAVERARTLTTRKIKTTEAALKKLRILSENLEK